MDRAPYMMDGGRWGYRMGPAEIHDSMLRDGLDDKSEHLWSGVERVYGSDKCPSTATRLHISPLYEFSPSQDQNQ